MRSNALYNDANNALEAIVLSSNTNNSDSSKTITEKRLKFSYFEPVAGILLAVVASVIFYFFPQIIAVVFVGGPLIPTFVETVIKSLWLPILLWAILRIGVEIFYLIERRYTKRLALITIIGNVLAFICTLIIFVPYRIVNVDYINWIHTYFTGGAAWFGELLARPNVIIIVIMLIGLILDSITVIIKGGKAKKADEEDADDIKAEEVSVIEESVNEEKAEDASEESSTEENQ